MDYTVIAAAGGYISIVKWLIMLVGLVVWLGICQWVDKDAYRLRYRRFTFNAVVMGAGLLGGLLWLLIPIFIVGMLFYVLIVALAVGVYVYLRNQLVPEQSRVLTGQHIANLIARRMPEPKVEAPPVTLLNLKHQEIPAIPEGQPLHEGYRSGQMLLGEAIDRRAERLVLSPAAQGVSVQVTVDGVPGEIGPIDRRQADLVIAYFKQSAGMDINDRRRPQQGKLLAQQPPQPVDEQARVAGYNVPEVLPARTLELEIRTSGSRAGETMVMQLRDQSSPLTLDRLGLAERQLELIGQFRRDGGGVVILGSSPGVGSTTTFYQMLRAHDAFMSNIQTLELSPEADLENITQHEFKAGDGEDASFSRQLQSILRRGPDVVGISQVKDKETAQLAARSADAVRFYVEMSGRDTFTLLSRWANLCGDVQLAMAGVKLVVAQTLIRTLCEGCKEAYRPDPQLLRKINLPADRIDKLYRPPSQIPVDKHGNRIACPLCQATGYRGRTGVFEVLVVDDALRDLVVRNASANEIKKYCRGNKMLYLQEEALRKVIAGETSINEVLRVFRSDKQ